MVPQSRVSAGTADRNHSHSRLIALYECRTFFGPNLDLLPCSFDIHPWLLRAGDDDTTHPTSTQSRKTNGRGRGVRAMWLYPYRPNLYRPREITLTVHSAVLLSRFVVFVEMRLELGHSLIPALHVPLTHLRAEHARGSCGMSAARASQSGPQPTTQHGCMPASRRRLAGRLPGRSNPTAGGRHEPSMAPSGHEAIHAKPRRPTCATSLHAIGALLIKQCVQLGSRRSLVHRFSCAAASGSRPPAGAAAP